MPAGELKSTIMLRDQLKAQILQSRVISRKVQPLVNVTDHELQEAMEYIYAFGSARTATTSFVSLSGPEPVLPISVSPLVNATLK